LLFIFVSIGTFCALIVNARKVKVFVQNLCI